MGQMYQSQPSLRDRAGPLAGVVLVHLALGYALLHLSGADAGLARRADLAIFDVSPPLIPLPPPPPPPPPPGVARAVPRQTLPRQPEAEAAPKNIESRPTEIVVPKPRIVLPAPSPLVAAVTPGVGANATQGASDVRGPGTGAGGNGNGTGGGGSGTGTGGGGTGLGEARARLLSRPLDRGDFPPAVLRRAPRGGTVDLILRVDAQGIPISCRVSRSFGDPMVDAETCRIAVARLRFAPGRDDQGRAVADYFGYAQRFD